MNADTEFVIPRQGATARRADIFPVVLPTRGSIIRVHLRSSAVKNNMRVCLHMMLVLALGLGGCAKKEQVGLHKDHPPHGGTPVALGENYHIEFVLDAASGTLSAYILDDEMEEFVRSAMPSFEVTARVGGAEQTLVFKPVANPATGETVGDTALFTAQADWLKTTTTFDAVIKSVTLDGTEFTHIGFNFPKGSD
jgi:hypothetical protein